MALPGGRKIRHVNICQYVPDGTWQWDLVGADGTVWTIESGLSKKDAIDRAEEFGEFSGLKVLLHGELLWEPDKL